MMEEVSLHQVILAFVRVSRLNGWLIIPIIDLGKMILNWGI